MLQRVDKRHGYGTRAARGGELALSSRDHMGVGYRVPTEEQRAMEWILGFLEGYGAFACRVAGCRVCGDGLG